MLIFGIIGFFIPNLIDGDWELNEWMPIISIALISGNIIYGGLLKSNFQHKLSVKDNKNIELGETLNANRDALTKSTLRNQQIKMERDFWKKRFEENELKSIK